MEFPYFVFPFNEVRPGSRIMIYGTGYIAQLYLQQIQAAGYCVCQSFIDDCNAPSVAGSAEIRKIGVRNLHQAVTEKFDYIVIASSSHGDALFGKLKSASIPENKIIRAIYKTNPAGAPAVAELLRNNVSTSEFGKEQGWSAYYKDAENRAQTQFDGFLRPIFKRWPDIDFTCVMDFACGEGRIARHVAPLAGKMICCDVNAAAIERCKERFTGLPGFEFIINRVEDEHPYPLDIPPASLSFIYSWDAMVHFDYRSLHWYLAEFYKLIEPGGYVMVHHSNLAAKNVHAAKFHHWQHNDGGRALTSAADVSNMAAALGFTVCEQTYLNWTAENSDCISLLRK